MGEAVLAGRLGSEQGKIIFEKFSRILGSNLTRHIDQMMTPIYKTQRRDGAVRVNGTDLEVITAAGETKRVLDPEELEGSESIMFRITGPGIVPREKEAFDAEEARAQLANFGLQIPLRKRVTFTKGRNVSRFGGEGYSIRADLDGIDDRGFRLRARSGISVTAVRHRLWWTQSAEKGAPALNSPWLNSRRSAHSHGSP
jgi:hypothetical protein